MQLIDRWLSCSKVATLPPPCNTHTHTLAHITLCRQDRVKHFPSWWHNTCFHILLKRPRLRKPDKLKLFSSWTFSFLHVGKTLTFVQAVQTTLTPSGVLPTVSLFFPKLHLQVVRGQQTLESVEQLLNRHDLSENRPMRQNNQHRMITDLMSASSDWSLSVYTHYDCM